MTEFEIREKINLNNKKISASFKPSAFVLNTEIAELMKENERLRAMCGALNKHKYENGVCIYCDSLEGSI